MRFQSAVALGAALAAHQAAAMPTNGKHIKHEPVYPPPPTPPCTTTTVEGPYHTPPPACNPKKGLQYIAQKDTFEINDASFSAFDPAAFKKIGPIPGSESPNETCLSSWNHASGNAVLFNHGSPIPIEYLNIHQRGYLMSEKGGKYTVTISGANDNIFLFWMGKDAVSGYSRQNAKATVLLRQADNTFSIDLKPGEAMPVRWMETNTYGPGVMAIEVTDPSGKSCFCNAGPAADCFYTDVCDASEYKFKPFGQED